VWDEESGELHRELEGFGSLPAHALAVFLSADGQQARLVARSFDLLVYDPEAGAVLHRLRGHTQSLTDLASIASSSAAPHHPRLVSASHDRTVRVWDGETGEMLAGLRGHEGTVWSVVVWTEHTGGHDRIATSTNDYVRVWDGEAFELLHRLDCILSLHIRAFKSAEGPWRLLVDREGEGFNEGGELQVWDPEEGRLLHDGISRGCPSSGFHMFESAQGRHLLAIVGSGTYHPRHPGDAMRGFLDVWDLRGGPDRARPLRAAHHLG
jgi:WD40 repeat protein